MKLFIALSAAFVKGDRVVVKFGTNQWYTGTVASMGKKVTVLFDDGEKNSYELGDLAVKVITSKRKSKSALTNADAKLLYSVAKPSTKKAAVEPTSAKKVKAPVSVKPEGRKVKDITDKNVPDQSQKPVVSPTQKPAVRQVVGSVIRTRFGNVAVLESKLGRKYTEYRWATVDSAATKTGWLKVRMHEPAEVTFGRFPFVRQATPDEMLSGKVKTNEVFAQKAARKNAAYDSIQNQDIKPGDVVSVRYSNGTKLEAVLEVDYRAAKLAIVRQYSSAAEGYSKRRLLPVSICTKVADGGGKFDPNNPLYAKHGIFVPDFYKSGNIVAPNRRKQLKERWDQ